MNMQLNRIGSVRSLSPLLSASLLSLAALASSGCVAELGDGEAEGQETQEVGVLAVPAVPNPITRISERCRGLNSIEFTAQAGATHYELWRSLSSSFTSPLLLSSNSSTSRLINVNMGSTWYLRAKACNAEGCSGYTTQVIATYFNGCV